MSIAITLDIEGVVLPEFWGVLADKTGQEAFRRTTTEVGDIAVLMKDRIAAAQEMGLTLTDIRTALADVDPLPGAEDFLRQLRTRWPTVLVSDTFEELLAIVAHKLWWPTVMCHRLQFDTAGRLCGYRLRQQNHKPKVVAAFHKMGYRVLAAGDSLNDIGMLTHADAGAFIHAPANIRAAHPTIPAMPDYSALLDFFDDATCQLDKMGPNTTPTI